MICRLIFLPRHRENISCVKKIIFQSNKTYWMIIRYIMKSYFQRKIMIFLHEWFHKPALRALESTLRMRARSLRCTDRYARPVNVKKAQRVSSFAYIYTCTLRNCNGLCIKHKAEPPAETHEAAISIKTSPIFRVYNRSDAPLWYRAFVAAFLPSVSPENFSYSFSIAASPVAP